MLTKAVSRAIFNVFCITRPVIEPRSSGPLVNTLPTRPMRRLSWSGIHPVGSDRGITHGLRSAPRVRKVVLWHFFVRLFVHFVDYRGRIFFAKLLQRPLGMPTDLWLSYSLPPSADRCWLWNDNLSCLLLLLSVLDYLCVSLRQLPSGLLCQLPSLCSFANCPSGFYRTSLTPHFRSRQRSQLQALCLVLCQNRQRYRLLGWLLTLCHNYTSAFEKISSSSSCRATSTDIPDPLSPLFPIVHRLWYIFRVTSRIPI